MRLLPLAFLLACSDTTAIPECDLDSFLVAVAIDQPVCVPLPGCYDADDPCAGSCLEDAARDAGQACEDQNALPICIDAATQGEDVHQVGCRELQE